MFQELYDFGALTTWVVLTVVFLLALGSVLLALSKAYVTDTEVKFPSWVLTTGYSHATADGYDATITMVIGALMLLVGGTLWIIFWPAVITYLCLRALRGAYRFKKIYTEHTHGKDGRIN